MTSSPPEQYIRVGTITKPHGVRGEVVVFLESDFPDWVAKRKTFFIEHGEALHEHQVLQSRIHHGKLVLRIEAIKDRNAAEAARGWGLFVPQDEAREPFEDDSDYFLNADLIGMVVFDKRAPDQAVGQVSQIYDLPMQQLIEIRKPDQSTFLVPFVAAIVTAIDLETGRMDVDLPEGIDDLEAETQEKS